MYPNSLRILTNYWGQNISQTWKSATTYCPPAGDDLISSLRLAIRLYRRRRQFDCIILGLGRSDIIFAIIQSALPFKKIPCIFLNCFWNKGQSAIKFTLKKFLFKIVAKSVDKFVVLSRREIESYSGTFNLPKEKFVFVPYHTTFVEYHNIHSYEGDYIFSGGNSCRDYETLIEAVRGLPIKTFIASTEPGISQALSIPNNVTVKGYNQDEYMRKMSGCYIHVVPLAPGLLRSAGQQTFLNAMWLGKPTIVTDIEGGVDYINHGEDGLLVPPGDPTALRNAIKTLLDHPERVKEIGINGMEKARRFSTDEYFKKIVSIAREIVDGNAKTSASGKHDPSMIFSIKLRTDSFLQRVLARLKRSWNS